MKTSEANKNQKFGCSYCRKEYSTKKLLKIHTDTQHLDKGDLYLKECPTCNKKFKQLRAHIRREHEKVQKLSEYEGVCPICNKRLYDDYKVKRHIAQVHDNQRDYNCSLCDRAFFEKKDLHRHIEGVHLLHVTAKKQGQGGQRSPQKSSSQIVRKKLPVVRRTEDSHRVVRPGGGTYGPTGVYFTADSKAQTILTQPPEVLVADQIDDNDEEIDLDVEIEFDHENTITVELNKEDSLELNLKETDCLTVDVNKEDTIECEEDQEDTVVSIVEIDQADNLQGELDEATALKNDYGATESCQLKDDYGTTESGQLKDDYGTTESCQLKDDYGATESGQPEDATKDTSNVEKDDYCTKLKFEKTQGLRKERSKEMNDSDEDLIETITILYDDNVGNITKCDVPVDNKPLEDHLSSSQGADGSLIKTVSEESVNATTEEAANGNIEEIVTVVANDCRDREEVVIETSDDDHDLRYLVSSTRQDTKGDLIVELEEKNTELLNNQMVKIRWGVPYVEPILTDEEFTQSKEEYDDSPHLYNNTDKEDSKGDIEQDLNPEKSAKVILHDAEADVIFNESEDSTMEEDTIEDSTMEEGTIEETECRIIEVGANDTSSMETIKCNAQNPSYSISTPNQGYSNTTDPGYSNTPDPGYSQIPDPIMDESIWRCPEQGCQLQFEPKQRGKYRKHYERIHLQIKHFPCQHCNFRFYEKSDLKRHIESVHSKIKIICPVDGCNTLTTRIDLHISKQHPAEKFKSNKSNHKELSGPKCEICQQVFNRMYDVNRHKNTVHFGRKSFECAECKRGFTDRRDLVRHNSAIHQSVKQVNKVFSCQHCKASYKRKKDLVQHLISNPHDGSSI